MKSPHRRRRGRLWRVAAGSNAGHVDVRSGRSGAVLRSYLRVPGELLGYVIADAGDVDGDGVHDVHIGAPQGGLYCTGTETGPGHDAVGIGDVTGDRRPELLVSAASGDTVYMLSTR